MPCVDQRRSVTLNSPPFPPPLQTLDHPMVCAPPVTAGQRHHLTHPPPPLQTNRDPQPFPPPQSLSALPFLPCFPHATSHHHHPTNQHPPLDTPVPGPKRRVCVPLLVIDYPGFWDAVRPWLISIYHSIIPKYMTFGAWHACLLATAPIPPPPGRREWNATFPSLLKDFLEFAAARETSGVVLAPCIATLIERETHTEVPSSLETGEPCEGEEHRYHMLFFFLEPEETQYAHTCIKFVFLLRGGGWGGKVRIAAELSSSSSYIKY